MTTITGNSRLFSWKPTLRLALPLAVLALLATPLGPLGGFWRPSPDIPVESATTLQLGLFMVLNIVEALTFGLGISFLVFGYPMVRAILPASPGLTRAAYLSAAWVMINWWMHDSLHTHVGMALSRLLAMEYAFHLTLMIAGLILGYFFTVVLRTEKNLR